MWDWINLMSIVSRECKYRWKRKIALKLLFVALRIFHRYQKNGSSRASLVKCEQRNFQWHVYSKRTLTRDASAVISRYIFSRSRRGRKQEAHRCQDTGDVTCNLCVKTTAKEQSDKVDLDSSRALSTAAIINLL